MPLTPQEIALLGQLKDSGQLPMAAPAPAPAAEPVDVAALIKAEFQTLAASLHPPTTAPAAAPDPSWLQRLLGAAPVAQPQAAAPVAQPGAPAAPVAEVPADYDELKRRLGEFDAAAERRDKDAALDKIEATRRIPADLKADVYEKLYDRLGPDGQGGFEVVDANGLAQLGPNGRKLPLAGLVADMAGEGRYVSSPKPSAFRPTATPEPGPTPAPEGASQGREAVIAAPSAAGGDGDRLMANMSKYIAALPN